MSTDTLATLATAVTTFLCDCAAGECALLHFRDPGVCRTLLYLLAEGQPVSVGTVAEVIGRPVAEVASVMEASHNVEWDEAGSLVGTGLTLRPTPHRMRVQGRLLYTWCALDTLMYAPLLAEQSDIDSPCFTTGTLIHVRVTRSGIASVTPAGAVVSIVVSEHRRTIRQSFCNFVHFFSSAEAAVPWLREHPGAVVLSVAKAYALGTQLTGNREQKQDA